MRTHEYLLDFFMTLFALASLALWGIILSGGSFSAYAILALLVPLVSAYLVFINNRGQIPSSPVKTASERYGNRFEIETLALFAMLLLIFFSKSEPVTVVLLLVALFLFLRQKNTRPWLFTSSSALERSPLIPGAALVIAVTYTLVSHRYDPDDALYLFFGLLPLDQPMQAINLFPFYDGGQDAGQLPDHRGGRFILDRDQFPAGVLPRRACPGGHAVPCLLTTGCFSGLAVVMRAC